MSPSMSVKEVSGNPHTTRVTDTAVILTVETTSLQPNIVEVLSSPEYRRCCRGVPHPLLMVSYSPFIFSPSLWTLLCQNGKHSSDSLFSFPRLLKCFQSSFAKLLSILFCTLFPPLKFCSGDLIYR